MHLAILIICLAFCVLPIIEPIIFKAMKTKKKSDINFNEFDDIEEIKKQEKRDRQNMEYEYNVLKNVADEASRRDQDVYKKVEEAKRHLYNFKILDSVEADNQEIPEGIFVSTLKENEENFNIELFKKWSRQIFECIKSGTEEQLKIVKYFMTEEMYDRLMFQIKEFEEDGLDFVTEDLIIKECNLLDYSKGMSKEEIRILITAKMKEYVVQKSTNRVIRGNRNTSYEKKIVMTFLKKNIENEEGFIKNCPNCGAETVQTEFGKCRYCNTLIFPIRYNWTLIKFESM